MRHYLNLKILWSEFNEFKTVGPYEFDWAAGQYKSPLSHYISTGLLAALQGLNLFWLFYIGRIAYRFIFQSALADERSDNDDNEFEEEMRLDALAKQQNGTPSVLLNGEALNGHGNGHTHGHLNGNSTAKENGRDALTNRKSS